MKRDDILSFLLARFQGVANQMQIGVEVSASTRWLDLGLDSVKLLGIFGELEEQFGLEVDEEAVIEYETLADLASLFASTDTVA